MSAGGLFFFPFFFFNTVGVCDHKQLQPRRLEPRRQSKSSPGCWLFDFHADIQKEDFRGSNSKLLRGRFQPLQNLSFLAAAGLTVRVRQRVWKQPKWHATRDWRLMDSFNPAKCCEEGINNLFGLFQAVFLPTRWYKQMGKELCLS